MRTRNTLISGVAAAVVATIGLGIAPAANAAEGSATATYTGQGFSVSGLPINDPAPANDGNTGGFANWDGVGDPYDAGDGYLLWVLSANGATSATINLPDGPHPMIKVGGTFKYASPYYSQARLMNLPVTADYAGTIKGTVKLTVSHGHAVPDSNVPSGVNFNPATGGTAAKDAVLNVTDTDPVFAYKKSHTNTYSWMCSNGDTHSSVQHLTFTAKVEATPILGDVTGEVVGWNLSKPSAGTSESYRTGTPQGTCPDGGSFVSWMFNGAPSPYMIPFVENIANGLSVNGTWLPNTL